MFPTSGAYFRRDKCKFPNKYKGIENNENRIMKLSFSFFTVVDKNICVQK
ncbi:hypothetical protein SAMN05216168_4488 [Kosakonia radicincitans]|nr:hypothetical protein SAMN05216168_4488 [Kosakonia radicincitans]